MKFKKSTLTLIVLALSLSGIVYLVEIQGATQREAEKSKQQQVFTFAIEDVQSLTLKTEKQTINLEKVPPATPPSQSNWQITGPSKSLANEATVLFLLDRLVSGKSDRNLTTSPEKIKEFGLDKPPTIIEIKLKNQQKHQLSLGKTDFSGNFIYAQTDSSTTAKNKEINILLVPIDLKNAIDRPLTEWQFTPEKSTTTPSPSPPVSPSPKP